MTKSVCTLGVCHPAPPHPWPPNPGAAGDRRDAVPTPAAWPPRPALCPPPPPSRASARRPRGSGQTTVKTSFILPRTELPTRPLAPSPGGRLWNAILQRRGTDRKPEVQRAGIPERVPQSPVSTGATNPSFYGENDQPAILGGAEAPSPREPVGNGQAPCTELPAALLYLPSWRRHLTKTSFSLRLRRPTATHYITSSDGREASRAARPLGAGAAGVRARCASALRWACQTPRAGRSAQPMVCLSAGSQPCADRGSSPAAAPSARHVSSATPLLGAEPGRGASGRRHLGG